jgi:hypothetical protein
MALEVYFKEDVARVLRSHWRYAKGRGQDWYDALLAIGESFGIAEHELAGIEASNWQVIVERVNDQDSR